MDDLEASTNASTAPPRPRSSRPMAIVPEARSVTVFRRRDVIAWGIEPGQIRTYLRQGLWVRLHHGVFTEAGVLADAARDPGAMHRLRTLAAIAALPVAAYAFGPTAALLHGLPGPAPAPSTVDLVRAPSADRRALRRRITRPSTLKRVAVHGHPISSQDVAVVDGVPAVTRDLAAVTAAATCTEEWAVAILDAAAWQRPDGPQTLAALTARWPQLRGIGTVRRALPLVRSGAQSPFESLSRVRLMDRGLPEPQLQVPIHDTAGLVGVVDMHWPEFGVIGECDGILKYTDRADLVREKAREDRLRALGFLVVRWTWPELMGEPAAVARKVRRAFALAQRGVTKAAASS